MNETYSKDTIDAKIDTIHERFNGMDTKLDALIIQAKLTNGRVRSLEKWRYALMGGLVVLAAVSSPNLLSVAKALAGQ